MMRTSFLIVAIFVAIFGVMPLLGCRDRRPVDATGPSNADRRSPSATAPSATAPPATAPPVQSGRFTRLQPSWTGINLMHVVDTGHPMRRLYHSGFICGGVAVGDVDGDDRPDLFFASGSGTNKLYRNLGELRFQDISTQAGIEGRDTWGAGATMVDIDADDDLDIYVCNYDAPNSLYINLGNGRFKESARQWKLDIVDASLMATFCDFDGDGDLDVYLLNNRYYRPRGRPTKPPWRIENGIPRILEDYKKYYSLQQIGPTQHTIEEYGRPDRLLRNNGDETFSEVTAEAGIAGAGYGLSATWWDYNADGWPDLYVCNDYNDPDRLYRNNGDGTFTNTLAQTVPHTPWFSMGSDAGDINNDGAFDLFAVDMSATTHYKQKTTMGVMSADKLKDVAGPPPQYMRNVLYLNTGTDRFMEIAYLAGLADSDWSWTAKLADLDNDGWLDVFVSNGMIRNFNDSDVPFDTSMLIGRTRWDLYQHLPPRPEQNLAFRNTGDLRFEDTSSAWGLDLLSMSYATALADLDGDHDLDMIVVNVDDPIAVYRNDVTQGRGITVRLAGSAGNRYGIGAKIRLETERGQQVRFMNPATGFLTSNDPVANFGVGVNDRPLRLTVTWPTGGQQTLTDVELNQRYTIEQRPGEAIAATPPPVAGSARIQTASPTVAGFARIQTATESVAPLFHRTERFSAFTHQEQETDDFALQPLLPNRLSQLGPGLAVADVDGDLDWDVYLGGAAEQTGQLLINRGDGRFDARDVDDLVADAACEDMGCLFFDLDADGDQDLYVVSGGVEAIDTPDRLQDRVYLNDGHGSFTRADKHLLPMMATSGGAVSACDFDRDGDLDLFVGGRVVPGKYPLAAQSYLLRNDDGQLVDATAELAPELLRSGLVTSALWSDADNDGWCDLWVTHEWGPVKLFQNQQGRLVDCTKGTGLSDRTGWWNGIASRDLDGDEDIDYVVTNFGLNTKYHASQQTPALLYYGDFENNGHAHLVEAEFEDEKLFPIRGRSCSSNAMPFLRNKYKTYHDFALAELDDLYTERGLNHAERFSATTLQSGVLINHGNLQFEFRALPTLAQVAPAFGVVVTEVNGDAAPDVYLVHNFFSPQPETGRMDGGLSLLLHGRGDGNFTTVWPSRSGLVVPGDAKSLVMADLDGDGVDEFLVGINDGAPLCFTRRDAQPGNLISVSLKGTVGNRHAVGARVTLKTKNGASQTAEVQRGTGYLSQSAPTIVFGAGATSDVESISVRWPDGTNTTTPGSDTLHYQIQEPSP